MTSITWPKNSSWPLNGFVNKSCTRAIKIICELYTKLGLTWPETACLHLLWWWRQRCTLSERRLSEKRRWLFSIIMAEARSAVAQPRIVELELDRNTWNDFARAWRRSVVKGFFRFRFTIVYVHSALLAADSHMTALLAPKTSCLVISYFLCNHLRLFLTWPFIC